MKMDTYTTSDFQTAAYIFTRYKIIPSITWIDSKKAEFEFSADIDFAAVIQDFLIGKKDVSPLQMFDGIARLKTLLFGSKKNRGNYENGYENLHRTVSR